MEWPRRNYRSRALAATAMTEWPEQDETVRWTRRYRSFRRGWMSAPANGTYGRREVRMVLASGQLGGTPLPRVSLIKSE